jgi:type IV secretory pathway VirB2 component (pilin)
MPFVFLIAGIVLIVAGVRGTSQQLLGLLVGDLTGPHNFVYWVIAIIAIGGLGYIQDLRTFSRALMSLILIVLVLTESKQGGGGGLFPQLESAIKQISGG